MAENDRGTQHTQYKQSSIHDGNMTISHMALLADIEQVFTEARALATASISERHVTRHGG